MKALLKRPQELALALCALAFLGLTFPLMARLGQRGVLCALPYAKAEETLAEAAAPASVSTGREFTKALADTTPEQALRVRLQLQAPELPNGCEVTSLAMAITAAGVPVDKLALYELLPRGDFTYTGENGMYRHGPDPEEVFVGDAASQNHGWYCFEAPLAQAGNAFLEQQGVELRVTAVSGLTRSELDAYALAGTPVVVWATHGYETPGYSGFSWLLPDGSEHRAYDNLHCVVVAGMSLGDYLIADPVYGWQRISPERFWKSFTAMGSRAVVVE